MSHGTDRELSKRARELIASARDGDAPSAEDRARVRRALAVAIAASAGTAAGATASAATSAKAIAASSSAAAAGGTASTAAAGAITASLFTKVAIAFVAIGVGSGAIVAVNHYVTTSVTHESSARAEPTIPELRGPEQGIASPAVDTPPATIEADAIEADAVAPDPIAPDPVASASESTEPGSATTSPRARRPRAAPRSAPTAEDLSSFEVEMPLLHDAVERGRSPAQRLVSVDDHASRFPHSALAEQREDARGRAVHDLCAQGPDAVAAFLATHPTSTSTALLHQTCPDDRR